MSINFHDAFFAKYHPATLRPPQVSFAFQKGDCLLLIGDSITEARKYTQMIETYLSVCLPELEIEVRNLGRGGETADGFLGRIETECLNYKPTVASICFGMNDAGYVNNNREAADKFRVASERIIRRLKAEGVRVVLSSPGCVGRLPPWDFVDEFNGTLDGINTSLMYMRDEAAAIAEAEELPFVDHFWNLYQARFTSTGRFGAEYAVCGADDGVHPSWAGHVVMAYGFFKALGFDGNLGTISIDLTEQTAVADRGHKFVAETEGIYTFSSFRYPFCAEGRPDKDWSIRSGMTLVPFNQEFNRMILKVKGATAPTYRVAWTNQQNMLEEWHQYTPLELAEGVNLAEQFQINPFLVPFRRIDDLIFQKQSIEANETWHVWESEGKSGVEGLAENEARRTELLKEVKKAFVPITHNIRVEAQG
jgi:lysophospholipase L1-like esterase